MRTGPLVRSGRRLLAYTVVYLRGSSGTRDGDTLVIEVSDDSQELPSVVNA